MPGWWGGWLPRPAPCTVIPTPASPPLLLQPVRHAHVAVHRTPRSVRSSRSMTLEELFDCRHEVFYLDRLALEGVESCVQHLCRSPDITDAVMAITGMPRVATAARRPLQGDGRAWPVPDCRSTPQGEDADKVRLRRHKALVAPRSLRGYRRLLTWLRNREPSRGPRPV
jgi:hypothetical protein